ncbi:MAG: GNAT family N-acetyltransferase [Lachnospiraceae bacterium]|jgi:ribosomal protein S18 acetylase RimI-like enzyme|nr:GNAT family N-acetyltransferase [Lachnospiraceae bacterium]
MEIRTLHYQDFAGKRYRAVISSDRYLSIEPEGDGFAMEWKTIEPQLTKQLSDEMLSDWLDDPVAYGAYEGDELIGFTEGFLETWNNRFRITNICIFDQECRLSGIGTKLLEAVMQDAVKSNARMIVLETQSYNAGAISFYKKKGFEIIGFDRYAYSNDDPKEHNMRIEMGQMLPSI